MLVSDHGVFSVRVLALSDELASPRQEPRGRYAQEVREGL